MISVTRFFRLGSRVAGWATPRVKEWRRDRHFNFTEGQRHLEAQNWAEAEKYLSLALAERRRPPTQRLELLLHLQKSQRHQHKLAEAEQSVRQAVGLAAKAWDRSWIALAKEALLDVQLDLRKYAEAERTVTEIQQLEARQPSAENKRLARCALKLAHALRDSGSGAEAVEAFQRAAELSEQALGSNHLETANVLSDLAALQQQNGNRADAERSIRRALEIRRAQAGTDSAQAAQDLRRLAAVLEESGDLAGAMAEYERVLTLYERQVGGDRTELAEAQARLAILYLHADRSSAARELLTHAIGTLERSGGECLAYALEALACVEDDSGRPAEAQRWRDKASKLTPAAPASASTS